MSVPEIEVHELAGLHGSGAIVVDVRNPDEYERARVPGARLIPLPEVPQRVDELARTEKVYVICASGHRSARAVEFLNGQGLDTVNVRGGTKAWVEAGHPVESGPV